MPIYTKRTLRAVRYGLIEENKLYQRSAIKILKGKYDSLLLIRGGEKTKF